MANLTENTTAWSAVYKIEVTDKVLGGDGIEDVANKQAKLLMQRDNYLKQQVELQSVELIKSLLNNSYTTDDLYIMRGVVVTISTTTVASDTATWTEGAIFYNNRVYPVPAGTVVKTGVNVFIFDTNTTVTPSRIEIRAGLTGTGIANHLAATVKDFQFKAFFPSDAFPNGAITSISTVTGCGAGIAGNLGNGDIGVTFSVLGKRVSCSGSLYISVPDLTASDLFLSGSNYAIGFIQLVLANKYRGAAGNSLAGGEVKTYGMAVCSLGGSASAADRVFGTSVGAPVFIDQDGNLRVTSIPPPGANKRVLISFTLDYNLA